MSLNSLLNKQNNLIHGFYKMEFPLFKFPLLYIITELFLPLGISSSVIKTNNSFSNDNSYIESTTTSNTKKHSKYERTES